METLRMILAWPVMAGVLIFVIWIFLKWLGKRIEKHEFNQDYIFLKFCVENSMVAESSFKYLAGRFNEIENNKMKDDKLLEKLRTDFEYKFREFFEYEPHIWNIGSTTIIN